MYYEISFPGLGLTMNPDRILLNLFGKNIYWYGVIIAVGFLLAVLYSLRRARQFGLEEDQILDGLLIVTPVAILCARAYYCVFYWELFADNPISVLYIWNGGLAIYGGVIGAAVAILLFTKFRKIRTAALLDLTSLGFLIGQSIGRWGNFVNREAFGSETTSFLRMGLTDAMGKTIYVHPTFLYESVWNLLGFVILHFVSKHRKFDGQIALSYLVWYGLGRGVIEGLRSDSLYFFGTGLRVSQFVAIASCLIGVVLLVWQLVFREHEPSELYVNQVKAEAKQNAESEDSKR